LPLRFPMRFSL